MPSPKLSDKQIIDCVINDEKDTCMQPLEEDNDKEINIISNKDALSYINKLKDYFLCLKNNSTKSNNYLLKLEETILSNKNTKQTGKRDFFIKSNSVFY